jgi:DNA-binding CsgD family transcriptional regulator/PAS domain-containing protein
MRDDRTIKAIEAIYAAAGAPGLWPPALDAIAACFDAVGTVLMMQQPGGAMITIASPVLTETVREYEAGGWKLDFMVPRAIERGFLAGATYTDRDLASKEEMTTHPFYTEFRPRYGLGHFIGALVSPHPTLPVIVTMQGQLGRPEFSDADVQAYVQLAHHVEKSLLLTVRILEAEAGHLAFADALSRLSCGVFLLDGTGHVIYDNRAAQQMVGRDLGVVENRLVVSGSGRTGFDEACRQMLAAGPSNDIAMAKPVLVDNKSGGRTLLHVLPVKGYAVGEMIFARSRLLVLAVEQNADQPSDPALIRDLLGLTLGEARLASLVGSGRSPREAAVALSLTEESARTVLKRVFAKAGVSKQSELAALLSRLTLKSM